MDFRNDKRDLGAWLLRIIKGSIIDNYVNDWMTKTSVLDLNAQIT
jgi:hypothetical protein